jgi:hypothetical protein
VTRNIHPDIQFTLNCAINDLARLVAMRLAQYEELTARSEV